MLIGSSADCTRSPVGTPSASRLLFFFTAASLPLVSDRQLFLFCACRLASRAVAASSLELSVSKTKSSTSESTTALQRTLEIQDQLRNQTSSICESGSGRSSFETAKIFMFNSEPASFSSAALPRSGGHFTHN